MPSGRYFASRRFRHPARIQGFDGEEGVSVRAANDQSGRTLASVSLGGILVSVAALGFRTARKIPPNLVKYLEFLVKTYLYLLKSLKDGKYYIGQTYDLEKRIAEHNRGEVPSTRYRAPLKLIGVEEYEDRDIARWREHELKKSAHKRKQFYKKFDGLRPYGS